MSNKKYYLTKEGYEKIRKDYEKLRAEKKEKLKEVPEALHSEEMNPEYLAFRRELSLLEEKIAKLEEALRNAEVIKPPSKNCKEIRLGATVTIEAGGEEDEFTLVGTMEADPVQGKLSDESPVGRALLGAREGDSVTVSSKVKVVYKIKKVRYR